MSLEVAVPILITIISAATPLCSPASASWWSSAPVCSILAWRA